MRVCEAETLTALGAGFEASSTTDVYNESLCGEELLLSPAASLQTVEIMLRIKTGKAASSSRKMTSRAMDNADSSVATSFDLP